MPAPVVEPIPPSRAVRLAPPDDAQEASYLAASARISSFCSKVLGIPCICCSLFVLFGARRIAGVIPALSTVSPQGKAAFSAATLCARWQVL